MYNKCIIVLFVLKNVLTTFGFKGNNKYMKPQTLTISKINVGARHPMIHV